MGDKKLFNVKTLDEYLLGLSFSRSVCFMKKSIKLTILLIISAFQAFDLYKALSDFDDVTVRLSKSVNICGLF